MAGLALIIFTPEMDENSEVPKHLIPWLVGGMLLLFVSIAGLCGLIVYYAIHAARSQSLSDAAKVAWIVSLWLVSVFAIPIYWLTQARTLPSNQTR